MYHKFNILLNAGKKTFVFFVILIMVFVLCPVNVCCALSKSTSSVTGFLDHITLSWTEDPKTTQTISWCSDVDTALGRVQYMTASEFDGGFDGAHEVNATKIGVCEGYYCFEATIRNLTPKTKYVYRVSCGDVWSEPAFFDTATDEDSYSFLYLGDVQKGFDEWGKMTQSAVSKYPDIKFALLGGDLVDRGNVIEEWQQFFLAASPVFKGLSLMPAVGNHDDEELFRQFFALPQNGPKGYEETFYSFDYGNCHIAVLNSNSMGIPGVGDYDKIVKWLKDDLKSSRQLWKFLVFHHPPYPVVEDWRAEHLQTNWVPIFEECGVDMIFVGHQHVYMRTKPICGGQVQSDGEGIVYVMGNSGTKYYAEGPDYDYIAKQLAWVSNYQVVEIDGKTLTLTARDADGNIIDTYSFTKQETDDKAQFNVVPVPNDVYTIGKTQDGICKMTVNEDQSGFKYFTVSIEPVVSHEGEETVVFTHIRTGKQIGLSATVADFDLVKGAQAGLHVNPGDIIKVFVIDKLTSDLDCNPIILQ